MGRARRALARLFGSRRPRAAHLDEAAFARFVAQSLAASAPQLEVTVHDGLELRVRDASGDEKACYLDNAYRHHLSCDPEGLVDAVAPFVAGLVATYEAPPVSREQVVPIVKDRAWVQGVLANHPAGSAGDPPLQVRDALNAALEVLYAQDTPQNIRYLTPDDLDAMGCVRSELRGLAVANLRRLLPRIERHAGERVSMLTADGTFESSLLLLDELWEGIGQGMRGDIAAAIPSRDLLLFADTADPDALDELQRVASDAVGRSPYALTDQLFVRRAGAFEPLRRGGPALH